MKKTVFVSAAVILLLAFLAATLHYKAERADQAGQLAERNRAGLVREHSPALGPSDARVRIVEFLDPACETCRRFYPFVKDMLIAHPDRIHLTLRYAPFHKDSDQVVALLLAAGRQGRHWETLEALLNAQDDWVEHHAVRVEKVWRHVEGLGLDMARLRQDMGSPEIARDMAQDLADARSLGVTKTPEYFVNGKPLPSFGYEPLKDLVDEALASAYPK
jgi:protein-disulfide isomerase